MREEHHDGCEIHYDSGSAKQHQSSAVKDKKIEVLPLAMPVIPLLNQAQMPCILWTSVPLRESYTVVNARK